MAQSQLEEKKEKFTKLSGEIVNANRNNIKFFICLKKWNNENNHKAAIGNSTRFVAWKNIDKSVEKSLNGVNGGERAVEVPPSVSKDPPKSA